MRHASRELLAPRKDVWGFLSEPNHLTDWWPGVRGVEVDRRGFAPGARWRVFVGEPGLFWRVPDVKGVGRTVPRTLVISAIDPFERWSWLLIGQSRFRLNKLAVDIRLRVLTPETTLVTIGVSGSRAIAERAVGRLYDLVQTAATL
jgi:hypothetical protein